MWHTDRVEEEKDNRLEKIEKRISEVADLAEQNNKMLKRICVFKIAKTAFLALLLIGGSGYGYYIFTLYQDRIIQFQEITDQVNNQAQKLIHLGTPEKSP